MSVKNNLKQIQEEFKDDEKLLESAFKLERFYRKYKYYMFAIVAFLVLWFGYSQLVSYQKERQTQKTSMIYDQLLKDPQNQVLLDNLKANSKDLFSLYKYAQAVKQGDKRVLEGLKNSQNPLIKILVDYQFASYSQNLEDLQKMHTTPMRDLAILQEVYLLQKEGRFLEARVLLEQIQKTSNIYPIASLLKHYGILVDPNLESKSTNNQGVTNQKTDKSIVQTNDIKDKNDKK